jgi:hypothetical protein
MEYNEKNTKKVMKYKLIKKYEKSNEIQINKNIYIEKSENINYEHSLKENLFDPTKSSPPNYFIINLHARIYAYNYSDTNLDNFKNE